jgi:hypothetical protein
MDQQRWQDPASPAPTASAPPAILEHGSRDAEAWAATPWAVVTATGIVQARCGQPTPAERCGAWRLSAPGGERWEGRITSHGGPWRRLEVDCLLEPAVGLIWFAVAVVALAR